MRAVRITILAQFLLLLSMTSVSMIVFAQETAEKNDPVYGFDPLLYNGRIYAFFPPAGTGGTQFLHEKFDTLGAITIRGITYTKLTLNYDVYNQQVVLKYKNALGTPGLIEISAAWLEEFDIYGRHFEIETRTDSTIRIYQVLGHGPAKILYYRRKELLLETRLTSINHYFPAAIREMYVKTDDQILKFKNNRSFTAIFSQPKQELIKKYLRKHKVKTKKANDFVMNELINYCNTLAGT